MYRKSFVNTAISSLKLARFNRIKDILDNEKYIKFDFVKHEEIDKQTLEEKISDYFEKVELMAGGKRFDFIIEKYVSDLDSIVRDHIDKTQRESRAKKYYDKAYSLRKAGLNAFDDLLDYSRIMLCLYMAIINSKYKPVSNFEYSSKCLAGKEIMTSLRNEKTYNILGEKRRFDTRSAYSLDRCTFIMVIIMYQCIKSNEVEAEK